MTREMRRSKQALTETEIAAVMHAGSHGVLACAGDNGHPYAVPLNYVYWNGKIYFHSAKKGHKLDAILKDPRVSFAVIAEDTILSEAYTSLFRSVIAFGRARIAEGDERLKGFTALVDKYCADRPAEERVQEVVNCNAAHIMVIDIEYITGKQAREYANGECKSASNA